MIGCRGRRCHSLRNAPYGLFTFATLRHYVGHAGVGRYHILHPGNYRLLRYEKLADAFHARQVSHGSLLAGVMWSSNWAF